MQTVSDKRTEANRIVRNHALWGAAVGVIPIPFLDLGSVAMVQEDMLRDMCKLYAIPFNEKEIKTRAITLAGGSLPRVLASAAKRLPGIGTVVGSIALPVLAGAGTYTMGQVVLRHFEEGGRSLSISSKAAKSFYSDLVAQGKNLLAKRRKTVARRKADSQTAEDIVWAE